MAKILIPTALRQFTEQSDSVEVTGATVRDALDQLTVRYPNIKKNLFSDQGKLRSFVNVYVNDEDIRYLDKDATKLEGNETISIVPSVAGGATALAEAAPALSNEEVARYSRHLILPEVGMEGQTKAQASQCSYDRGGWPRCAARLVSGCGGSRTYWNRRLRRGRCVQPPTAGHSWHQRYRPQEAGLGSRPYARYQPQYPRR